MPSNRCFPDRGLAWPEIEQALYRFRAEDHEWRPFGLDWPHRDTNIRLVGKSAADIFFDCFLFGRQFSNPSAFPVWDQVSQMVREILSAPEGSHCTITSGGTESNFLATKAARDKAKARTPGDWIPEIVIPYTAHPSFDKAAHYLGLKVIRVRERPDFRADVTAMEAAVTDRTILLVGSAPAYPHGRIDPIPEIAALAAARNIWCHVDSCIGGFLLPFLKRLGHKIPDFAFDVPGVTSVSADLHKFGQTPMGISTLTLRDAADLEYQAFVFDAWPSGRLRSEGFVGSGTGRNMAAAWAVLKHLGQDGYTEQARRIARASEVLADGIEKMGQLEVLVRPEGGILLFRPLDTDVRAVAEALLVKGFGVVVCEEPLAIHLFIDAPPDDQAAHEFLAALGESLNDARAGRFSGEHARKGYS
jgi:sphinganine-1-phosphate aldolase